MIIFLYSCCRTLELHSKADEEKFLIDQKKKKKNPQQQHLHC